MPAQTPASPPPPPPKAPKRLPAGYTIREDLDDSLRAYAEETGALRKSIIDQALEEYLARRGMWPLDEK